MSSNRHRELVLEAALCLIAARALLRWARFEQWRNSLGKPVRDIRATTDSEAELLVLRIGSAVERAVRRLPGHYKCLPRAMAVQWMCRRRGLRPTLIFGALAAQQRGHLDDLHAWVTTGEHIAIGASDLPYVEILRLA